jgi:hypothetical protein
LIGTLVAPFAGISELTANADPMVNVTALVVWPEVATLMFTAPSVAFAAMANVAVISVLLTTVVLVTVIPAPAPLIVAPVSKSVPVRVTGTVWPWAPAFGLIEVSVGEMVPTCRPHPATNTTSRSAINHILLTFRVPIRGLSSLSDMAFPSRRSGRWVLTKSLQSRYLIKSGFGLSVQKRTD